MVGSLLTSSFAVVCVVLVTWAEPPPGCPPAKPLHAVTNNDSEQASVSCGGSMQGSCIKSVNSQPSPPSRG